MHPDHSKEIGLGSVGEQQLVKRKQTSVLFGGQEHCTRVANITKTNNFLCSPHQITTKNNQKQKNQNQETDGTQTNYRKEISKGFVVGGKLTYSGVRGHVSATQDFGTF